MTQREPGLPNESLNILGFFNIFYIAGLLGSISLFKLDILPSWSLPIIGGLTTISYLILLTFFQKPYSQKRIAHERFRKFEFLRNENWHRVVSEQQSNNPRAKEHVFTESFLISEVLEDFIDLILNEFVNGWSREITSSSLFEDSIKIELKTVFRNLKTRMENVDFARLLVSKLIPVLHDHFNNYLTAEATVRHNHSHGKSVGIEYDLALARCYNKGKLHPGVSITLSLSNDENEKNYLRNRIGSILPLILTNQENNNDTAIALVREILACTILSNVFEMVSESDFYNLLIVKLIGDNMKHRDQVKQLRAALAEHTQHPNTKDPSEFLIQQHKQISINNLNTLIVKENMTNAAFKKLISYISNFATIEELEHIQLRHSLILSKIKPTKRKPSTYVKRLNLVKFVTQEKILKLRSFNPDTLPRIEKLTLMDILNDLFASSAFAEFMNDQRRSDLLSLYQTIDLIKAPLEEYTIDDNDETDLSLSLEFIDLEDVRKIYEQFFKRPDISISKDIIDTVEEYVRNNDPYAKNVLYKRARRALFKLQADLYEIMSDHDFPEFKKSGRFSKLSEMKSFHENHNLRNVPSTMFLLESKGETLSPLPDDSDPDNVSPTVVKAVEDAFSEIMKTSPDKKFNKTQAKNNFRKNQLFNSPDIEQDSANAMPLTIDLKKDLFGDPSTLFEEDNANILGRHSRLFDDESEDLETDTDSSNTDVEVLAQNSDDFDLQASDLQVHLAAPGNLRLSEEISKLNGEIDKLIEQQHVLEPLLKKAELTNNVGELKILRKSKTSLDREIASKELQKQQYIVQENDNSLYAKSRVHVQSYISGNERGKEFILYIIEVQRFSSEDPDVVTAGWIVARRFSQFFKLHEYLKAKYPEVANLKFPKRTVLVLKFQQKQLVEWRKSSLEEYLQSLINIPRVCSNRAFRSFLSSENFNLRKNQPFDDRATIQNNTPSNLKTNVEMVANKLYNGIQNRFVQSGSLKIRMDPEINDEVIHNVKEMQSELKQFDEVGLSNEGSNQVFVKPICDILISIFRLNSSKSWLRGRALLVILQQIFGTTIEKKVYEQVEGKIKNEEQVLDILNMLKQMVFPNGKFKDPPILRTIIEKETTRREAKGLLTEFMVETCSKIFGLSNTNFASTKLFSLFQNDFLNEHLILEIFDALLKEVFPDLNDPN